MAAAMGAIAQFGIGDTSTVDMKLELVGGDIGLVEEFAESNGITGTRSHPYERVRANLRRVSGSVTLHPNSAQLDVLLPWILGGTESTNVFPVAEALSAKYVSVDRVTKVFTYSGVVVSRAVFRASQGTQLEVVLDLEGIDETVGNAGTFPSLTISTAAGPYLFSDCTGAISVGGSAYGFRSWELTVDNMVDGEQFYNNLVRQRIPAKDRVVSLRLEGPYGDLSGLYNTGVTGAAINTTFTNGSTSILFACVKAQFPRLSPQLNGKEEIMTVFDAICRTSSTTKEIIVTNAS